MFQKATIGESAQRALLNRADFIGGEGKSRDNALKHGLSAARAVVFGEDVEAFDAHARRMRDEFRPATPMEKLLVDRIIEQSWKLRRVPDAEREAFWQCERAQREDWNAYEEDEDDGSPITPGKVIARSIHSKDGTIERVQNFEQRIERSIHASIRALRQLRRAATPDAQVHSRQDVAEMQNEPIFESRSSGDACTASASRATPLHETRVDLVASSAPLKLAT